MSWTATVRVTRRPKHPFLEGMASIGDIHGTNVPRRRPPFNRKYPIQQDAAAELGATARELLTDLGRVFNEAMHEADKGQRAKTNHR